MTDTQHHELKLYGWVTNPKINQPNVIESVRPIKGVDIEYPNEGVNLLYGKRFARETLAEVARAAKAQGNILIPVEIRVSAIRPTHAKHWFDRVEGKNVFDIHRLNPDQEALVADCWKRYLDDDGVSCIGVNWDRREFIGQFPSFLDRIHNESPFRDTDVLIWRTKEKGKVMSRATLYNRRCVISMRAIGAEHLQVVLPAKGVEAA